MEVLNVKTRLRSELVPITSNVQDVVNRSGIGHGMCIAFVPHTTAGVTINENADPDVAHDVLYTLDKLVPWNDSGYRHGEGNSAAHLKASMMGSSVTIVVEDGKLQLGTWQGVYFAEFDGPRYRKLYVEVVGR